jgi:hypothetical protein
LKKITSILLALFMAISMVPVATVNATSSSEDYVEIYEEYYPEYLENDQVIADEFLATYNNSEAQALVARAIWYMENGYMIYGHSKYWDTGYIDCSNFVSLVYKDLGYEIPTASKDYDQVGEKIAGVYSRQIAGSTKYELVGLQNLRPGDIFTFWKADTDGSGTHIGHVAIYVGEVDGNPTVIQTNTDRPTAIGIRTEFRYWYGEHFEEARRVLDDDSQDPGKEWEASSPVIPDVYQLTPQNPILMPQDCFMRYSEANEGTTDTENDEDVYATDGSRVKDSDDASTANTSGQVKSISPLNNNKETDPDLAEIPDDVIGHWAESAINEFIQADYLSGYPDGQFRPDNAISRAEFTSILLKSLHLDMETGKTFNDTADHWASDYISTACKEGIVNGYSVTQFGPDDPITREQMLVMFVKAVRLDTSAAEEGTATFSDYSQISDWAKNAVLMAYQADFISGYSDGSFKPQDTATRAEAVTVLRGRSF